MKRTFSSIPVSWAKLCDNKDCVDRSTEVNALTNMNSKLAYPGLNKPCPLLELELEASISIPLIRAHEPIKFVRWGPDPN